MRRHTQQQRLQLLNNLPLRLKRPAARSPPARRCSTAAARPPPAPARSPSPQASRVPLVTPPPPPPARPRRRTPAPRRRRRCCCCGGPPGGAGRPLLRWGGGGWGPGGRRIWRGWRLGRRHAPGRAAAAVCWGWVGTEGSRMRACVRVAQPSWTKIMAQRERQRERAPLLLASAPEPPSHSKWEPTTTQRCNHATPDNPAARRTWIDRNPKKLARCSAPANRHSPPATSPRRPTASSSCSPDR